MGERLSSDKEVLKHQISDIASKLEVSEYDLFVMAYEGYYGHPGRDHEIECAFGRYLNTGVPPCYVRHYVRSRVDGPLPALHA